MIFFVRSSSSTAFSTWQPKNARQTLGDKLVCISNLQHYPAVRIFKSQEEENGTVAAWLADRSREGVMPHEFGVFIRSDAELDRARAAVTKTGLPFKMLDEHVETTSGQISIGTMHLAKGLEFRAVVVMACVMTKLFPSSRALRP
jgi:superfamily I DNA/RNA helicase